MAEGDPASTGAIFSGMAYPGSKVFLLKDGQVAASTIAGGDAHFKISLMGLSSGDFIFLVYAEDTAGRRSTLFTLNYEICERFRNSLFNKDRSFFCISFLIC